VDEPKVSSVRGVLIVPVAMVVWILVADPSFLGLDSRPLRQFVSSAFGIDLGIRGQQQ
jgi:hypothetical protein